MATAERTKNKNIVTFIHSASLFSVTEYVTTIGRIENASPNGTAHIATICSAKTLPTTVKLLTNPATMAKPNGSIEIRRSEKSPALVCSEATRTIAIIKIAPMANAVKFKILTIFVEGLKRTLREEKMIHDNGKS